MAKPNKQPAARVAPKKTVVAPSSEPVKPVGRVQIAPKPTDPGVLASQNAAKVVEGEDAVKAGKDIVKVNCPNSFNLTMPDHSLVHYAAGTLKMPREHAEHWYAINNGVEINE